MASYCVFAIFIWVLKCYQTTAISYYDGVSELYFTGSNRSHRDIANVRLRQQSQRHLLPSLKSNLGGLKRANDGVYKIEFHSTLNALYSLLFYWNCKPTIVIIDDATGFSAANVVNFFHLHSSECQPEVTTAFFLKNNSSDEKICDILLPFRYFVYISVQTVKEFFIKASKCHTLFASMRSWVVISNPSQIQHFSSSHLQIFAQSLTSQITYLVPISTSVINLQQSMYILSGFVSRVDMYDVFLSRTTMNLEAILFAYWSPEGGLYYKDRIDDVERLRGRNIRILTVTTACPFVCLTGPNKSELARGYGVDIFLAMENYLKVNQMFSISKDGFFGSPSPNGSFNGFIGELQRGEHDLVMMATAITAERKRYAVHYGAVLIDGDMQITIKRPLPLVPPTIYMLPFQMSVWYTVFGSLIVIYVIMIIIHRVNIATNIQQLELKDFQRDLPNRQRVNLDFFDQMGNFRGLAARVVVLTQIIGVLLVFTYYTSVLTSFLTYREIKLPFHTLDELASKKDYRVLTVKDTIYQQAFELAKEGVYKRIWNKIVADGKRGLIPDFTSGFKYVSKDEKCAYLTNGFILQGMVKKGCTLMFVPAKYMKESFHVPFRMDFPYKKIYDNSMLRLREAGVYKRLEKLYITAEGAQCEDKGASQTLEITQVYALFAFLLGSWIVALVAMLIEILFYSYKRSNMRQTIIVL